jgi:hypothetical protein
MNDDSKPNHYAMLMLMDEGKTLKTLKHILKLRIVLLQQ